MGFSDELIDAFAWNLSRRCAESINDQIMSDIRRDLYSAMTVPVSYELYGLDKIIVVKYTELHMDVSTDYSKSQIKILAEMARLGSMFFPPQEAQFTMIGENDARTTIQTNSR